MNARHHWPKPQPQPETPVKGGPVSFTFNEWQLAKCGVGAPEVIRLYQLRGGYAVKPKRNSRGLVWNDRAFWWTAKGFYRSGDVKDRRPLQHLIYEHATGKQIPRGYEIFFIDRDRHNFSIENMEMMTKAALHRRTIEIGEFRQPTHETRCVGRQRGITTRAREKTALLLQRFESKDQHANDQLIEHLGDARIARNRDKTRAYKARWYRARKERQAAQGNHQS
jgi:hypothetical protein